MRLRLRTGFYSRSVFRAQCLVILNPSVFSLRKKTIMTGITGKTTTYHKSDNITTLYNLLPKIQSEFKRLDVKSGYYRDQEDINDISEFYLELIDKNWMKKVDLEKIKFSNSTAYAITNLQLL